MRIVKEAVKELLYRPRGVVFGARSFIKRPYSISGARHLRLGARSCILPGLRLQAITSYAGVSYNPTIDIGDDVYIGGHAYFTAVDRIAIGSGCVLSEYVYITDEVHGNNPNAGLIMRQPLLSKGPVTLGPGCFIGFRAAIMPGVTLGEHCIVGANSTVTRSFPSYSMVGGSPARLLKVFSHDLGEWIAPPGAS